MIRRFVLAALILSAASSVYAAEPHRPEGRALETRAGGEKAASVEAEDSYLELKAALKLEDARVRAHNKALRASEEYTAAQEANDRKALEAFRQKMERVDYAPFVERALGGASQFSRTDSAIDFLGFIAQRGKKEQAREALATLQEHHVESAKLAECVGLAGWFVRSLDRPTVLEFLHEVDTKNQHDAVRAQAIYQTYRVLRRDREVAQEVKDAAEARLPEAARLAGEGALRDRINAPIFEKERLQIGMVAPDIEAADLDGVTFKLSDYRGKVVVLDFWGDW